MVKKPISVAKADFIAALCDLINDNDLPFCVTLDAMTAVIEQVKIAEKKQYDADRAAYEAALKEEEAETNTQKEEGDGDA